MRIVTDTRHVAAAASGHRVIITGITNRDDQAMAASHPAPARRRVTDYSGALNLM